MRLVASGFLGKLGYRIDEAADAQQALARIEADPSIDLLFTDVVMRGELDGPALARQARQLRPGLRVVFTSGHAADAFASIDPGCDGELLPKPYRIDQLARIVRRTLDAAPPAAGAGARRTSVGTTP